MNTTEDDNEDGTVEDPSRIQDIGDVPWPIRAAVVGFFVIYLLSYVWPPGSAYRQIFVGDGHVRPLLWWVTVLLAPWVWALMTGWFRVSKEVRKAAVVDRLANLAVLTAFPGLMLSPRNETAKYIWLLVFTVITFSYAFSFYEKGKERRKIVNWSMGLFAIVLYSAFIYWVISRAA